MKKCPKCGRVYSDFITECATCKLPLNANAAPQTKRPTVVPQSKRQEEASQPRRRETTWQEPVPKKKNKLLPFLIAGIVIVVALGLLSDKIEEEEISGGSSSGYEVPAARNQGEPEMQTTRQGAIYQENLGDILVCTIEGQELELNQTKAFILGDRYMKVEYECMNPRGERMYHLTLSIKSNAGPGTYTSEDSSQIVTVLLTKKGNAATYSADHTGGGVKLYGRTTGSYTLKITDRSDDWLTYGGTLEAVVEPMTGDKTLAPITIEDGFFQFTLE